MFIQSPPAQAFIQQQLNLRIPGTLSWEKFNLVVRDGRVQVSGVHLKDASGKAVAGIEQLEADLNWAALLQKRIELTLVKIDRPDLNIHISDKGDIDLVSALVSETKSVPEPEEPTPSKPIDVDLQVKRFELNHADIHVASPEFKTDLSDLSVGVDGFHLSELCASIKVALSGGRLVSGQTDLTILGFDAGARIDKEAVSDIDLHAKTPGLTLGAKGAVNGFSGGAKGMVLDITSLLEMDADLAAKNFGLSQELFKGKGQVHLAVKGGLDNPNADISLEFGPGLINGASVSGIKADAILDNRHICFDKCQVDLPAGIIPFGGHVDLSKAFPKGFIHSMAGLDTIDYAFFLESENLSLQALELSEKIPKGFVDAKIEVAGHGVIPGQITAEAGLDVTARELELAQLSEPVQLQLKTGMTLKKDRLTLTGLDLNGAGMTGTGTATLDMPGVDPEKMTVQGVLDLEVADLSIPVMLAGQTASGSAGLHVDANGALMSPDLNLALHAENLSSSRVRVDELTCRGRMDKGQVIIENFMLKRNKGILTAGGSLDTGPDKTLDLSVSFDNLDLGDLAPDTGAAGRFSGRVTGAGTLKSPAITLSLSGQGPGFQNYILSSLDAQIQFADNILTFNQARIQQNNAHMDITGQIDLSQNSVDVHVKMPETDLKGVDPAADAALASGRLGLELSATGQLMAPDISGQIFATNVCIPNAPDMAADANIKIEAHGPLDNPAALKANVDITRMALSKQDQNLILIENAKAFLDQGRFELSRVPVKIMDKGQLTLWAKGDINGDLNAEASGAVPVVVLVPLAQGINSANGDILISLSAKGRTAAPELLGSVEFSNINLDLEALEEPLEKICGRIVLSPDAVEIQDVKAGMGDGLLAVSGRAELENRTPEKFDFKLSANQVPVDIPDTMEMTLSSQLTWAGTMKKSALTGGIDIFEGTYYKDLDLSLMSLAMDSTKKSRPKTREPGPEYLKTIDLNIYVTRRDAISVDNNLATMSISPNLTVRGTALCPGSRRTGRGGRGVHYFSESTV